MGRGKYWPPEATFVKQKPLSRLAHRGEMLGEGLGKKYPDTFLTSSRRCKLYLHFNTGGVDGDRAIVELTAEVGAGLVRVEEAKTAVGVGGII